MESPQRSVVARLRRLVDPPALRDFLRRLRAPKVRRTLAWSLPAVLVAVLLRGYLLAHMPAAFVHNDTGAALETARNLLERGAFTLDAKKTFLAPALYVLPALLHLPVLPFVAVTQHLLGVALVFLTGLLTMAWLRHWRVWIIPVTLAAALNPALLWYEHTALAESLALFGVVALVTAATLFWRMPCRYSLALLLLSLLFLAGARPEGRLFAVFVMALVVRRYWRQPGLKTATLTTLLACALTFAATRTGQSGLLLFTSVLHLAPPHLVASPGVAEVVQPLVPIAHEGITGPRGPKLVPLRKSLQRTLAEAGFDPDAVGKRAGLEIILRHPAALPDLALRKFVIAHRELPAGTFNDYAIAGQLDALDYRDDPAAAAGEARLLWGVSLPDATRAEAFLRETYRPIPGDLLTRSLALWQTLATLPVAPVDLPGANVDRVPLRGLPWLYAAALGGMIALACRERPLGLHHLLGGFLLAFFVVIMVTANVRARFRILFEPFWILYAAALADSLCILLARWRARFA